MLCRRPGLTSSIGVPNPVVVTIGFPLDRAERRKAPRKSGSTRAARPPPARVRRQRRSPRRRASPARGLDDPRARRQLDQGLLRPARIATEISGRAGFEPAGGDGHGAATVTRRGAEAASRLLAATPRL